MRSGDPDRWGWVLWGEVHQISCNKTWLFGVIWGDEIQFDILGIKKNIIYKDPVVKQIGNSERCKNVFL